MEDSDLRLLVKSDAARSFMSDPLLFRPPCRLHSSVQSYLSGTPAKNPLDTSPSKLEHSFLAAHFRFHALQGQQNMPFLPIDQQSHRRFQGLTYTSQEALWCYASLIFDSRAGHCRRTWSSLMALRRSRLALAPWPPCASAASAVISTVWQCSQ